ncbi:ParB/RepB/Spo0J family partition protein [SCandidatus Aminicenantes bacterium Aminicenantia_JdfR_composite]|jgi:ParB family chromosome partitioning protein|nr:ParB/RepB/Spo0J family partition protein [SCandidatus Aminicenantes bacterium Aminicenantia_JdfR_composite]MCP2597802.1 ParB/RepB/Spo0J family partition protein [Candidatus Aminicenantes bacterium AC-335-L06]MCP2620527.1 ParB/RepB/Spo0J family partition protein [Candidatus Aminicenantes bacterium AC-334-E05]
MRKKALGKGIKAFLSEDLSILKEERYIEIDIDQIKPSPYQPRVRFDEESIKELAESIKKAGVIQPIMVVPQKDHYQIVTGERRWRAAQKIGLKKIPAIVKNIPKEKQIELSLIENLQREDLNPLEIAQAYKQMTELLNLTHQEIAERVGKDRASVTNYLRLLKLPQEIQKALLDNKISMGHARAILALEDPEHQLKVAHEIIKRNLSVRETERLIKKFGNGKERKKPQIDPDISALEEELMRIFSTKVKIRNTERGGYVKIYYYNKGDLERIYNLIKG